MASVYSRVQVYCCKSFLLGRKLDRVKNVSAKAIQLKKGQYSFITNGLNASTYEYKPTLILIDVLF